MITAKQSTPLEYIKNVQLLEKEIRKVIRNTPWFSDVPTVAIVRIFISCLKYEENLEKALSMLDLYRGLIKEDLEEHYKELDCSLEELIEKAKEYNRTNGKTEIT